MSDSDDYNESSDEDYVPNAEEVSEEEESGEDEDFDPAAGDDGAATNGAVATAKKGKGKRKAKGETIKRQRKGGIKLEGDVEEKEEEDVEKERKEKEEEDKKVNEEVEKEVELMKEKEETKKIDDLWSSFLSDVKQKPKSAMALQSSASSSSNTTGSSGSLASLSKPVSSSPSPSSTKPTSSTSAEKKPEKVTITKIFDFAGEEVRVTKEVAANSKEAKDANKEQTSGDEKESSASSSPGPGISGVKRPAGGLGSVLGKIGKKQKISVLNTADKVTIDNFEDLESNTAYGLMENLQPTDPDQIYNRVSLSESHKRTSDQNSVHSSEVGISPVEKDKTLHPCESVPRGDLVESQPDEATKQLGRFSCQSNCKGKCQCFAPGKSRVPPPTPWKDDPLDKFLKDRENDWDCDDEPSLQIRSLLNLT